MTEREIRAMFTPLREHLDELEQLLVISNRVGQLWEERCAGLAGAVQLAALFKEHGVLDGEPS